MAAIKREDIEKRSLEKEMGQWKCTFWVWMEDLKKIQSGHASQV